MKLIKKAFAVAMAAALSCVFFAACNQTGGSGDDVYYTVQFDANGGTMSQESSVRVKEGESVTLPEAAQEGYSLNGWYHGTERAGAAGESYRPAGDVTLKAEWTQSVNYEAYASENMDRAVEYAKLIQSTYWNSSSKLSKLTPVGGAPCLWPYTEQVAMVNGILLNMEKDDADYQNFATYLEELIVGLRHYRVSEVRVGTGQSWNNADHYLANFGETDGSANAYAIYNSGRNDGAIDAVSTGMSGIYFDDNIWVAKEFYYAYLNLGKVEYLNEAVNIVNWIVGEGYESTKGLNGIYWKWSAKFLFDGNESLSDDTHASLNACSSAPTAMMLAKLHQTLSEPDFAGKFGTLAADYHKKAQNIYEFCYSVLRNTTNGCLRDKIFLKEGFKQATNQSQQIQMYDEQILPYNTGTYMTAGAELYKIAVAGNKTAVAKIYKERNSTVAADADRQFANTQVVQGQYSYNKNSWFTSFILEGFIDLSDTVDCSEYIEHMRSALDYAWKNNRAEDKLVCPSWVAGWGEFNDNNISEGNPRQILLQSANAHCYAMLARYYAGL